MSKNRNKAGLLGLGKVGTNLLFQHKPKVDRFRIHWLSDSKHIYQSKKPNGFSKKELTRIIKQRKGNSNIQSCDKHAFQNANQQARLLSELIDDDKDEWLIFDATFTDKQKDFTIADAMMGCKAYCAANKATWADHDLCSILLRKAGKNGTLLGLNTTIGVWLDQMEILPIIMRNITGGQIKIWKRDNSSFNLFFTKIGSGLSVEKTLRELERSGYLDVPGPGALLTEVKDQTMKAHIAANICGLMQGIKPVFNDPPPTETSSAINAIELADWHLKGRRSGNYPALVSWICVDLGNASVDYQIQLMQLPNRHPLAKDYPGKCAIAIDPTTATFTWSKKRSASHTPFVRSGYGGPKRTAAKLLDEASRAANISRRTPRVFLSPLLALAALEKNESTATHLEKELAQTL
jgi:hypothetical protein